MSGSDPNLRHIGELAQEGQQRSRHGCTPDSDDDVGLEWVVGWQKALKNKIVGRHRMLHAVLAETGTGDRISEHGEAGGAGQISNGWPHGLGIGNRPHDDQPAGAPRQGDGNRTYLLIDRAGCAPLDGGNHGRTIRLTVQSDGICIA